VYDVGNRMSFENVEKWLSETKNYSNEKIFILLIGNKKDLEKFR
jgi:GTPase SAR1 family protein